MKPSTKRTTMIYVIPNVHRPSIKRLMLILILGFSLLFAACGSNDGGDSGSNEISDLGLYPSNSDNATPADSKPDAALSEGERIELAKDILYTAYSGIGESGTAPLYDVMVNDLNELAVTLAFKTFQSQALDDIFQREDLIGTLEDLMDTIGNEALLSRMDVLMNNLEKEQIILIIENLISNFRELITALEAHSIDDIGPIIQSSIELASQIDYGKLSSLIDNEFLFNAIRESILTITDKISSFDFRFNIEELTANIEDAINTIKSRMIDGVTGDGPLDLLSNLIAQWIAEGKNTITFENEGVTTIITISGLDNIVSGTGNEVTLTLSADFDASGFALESFPCTYTGNAGGSTDIEAVIVTSISDTQPMVDIKSVDIKTYNTLHASYPTYEVQYGNWEISYDIKRDTLLNASLISLIEDLIQYPENFTDNRDYTVTGNFLLNGKTYEITGMHYVQQEMDDGTLNLSINGSILANLTGTDIPVDVSSSNTIKCSIDGLWVDSQLDITIGQDMLNVIFDLNGSATINGDTIPLWQEELNPLN